MEYEVREHLAAEFAGVIKTIREEKWDIFSEAAQQIQLDPYTALARMLVRMVEDIVEGKKPEGFDPERN